MIHFKRKTIIKVQISENNISEQNIFCFFVLFVRVPFIIVGISCVLNHSSFRIVYISCQQYRCIVQYWRTKLICTSIVLVGLRKVNLLVDEIDVYKQVLRLKRV